MIILPHRLIPLDFLGRNKNKGKICTFYLTFDMTPGIIVSLTVLGHDGDTNPFQMFETHNIFGGE